MGKTIKLPTEQAMALRTRVNTLWDSAYSYMTMNQLGPAAESWQYYHGELPKVQLEGGDGYVERVVEECVNSVLQDLMTVFTSQDDAVTIEPSWDLQPEVAQALSDRINKVLIQDNEGYSALHDAWKEMLVARNGWVKVWWENKTIHKADSIEGVPVQAVAPYLQAFYDNPHFKMKEDDVEVIEYDNGTADVTIKYTADVGRLRLKYVPFQNVIIDQQARSVRDATYLCHHMRMTKAEMIDAGFDSEIVASLNYYTTESANLVEWDKTNGTVDPYMDEGTDSSDYAGKVWLKEHYLWTTVLDKNNESRLYQVLEAQGNILSVEEVEFIPFVSFRCMPLPGVVYGESIADLTKDLQNTQSRLMRATIDNAQYITYGRYLADTSRVDMRSLLDNSPGGIIEFEGSASGIVPVSILQEAQLPQSVPLAMQFIEGAKEARTGVSKTSQGLSKDMLKGDHGFDTVNFLVSQSQGRSRMMARNVARDYCDLIRMIISFIRDNSVTPLNVRTPTGFVPFYPQQLPLDVQLKIKPALSAADKQEEAQKFLQTLQGLQAVSSAQSMFLGVEQRYALSQQWLDVMEVKDLGSYMMNIQQYQAPQPSPMDIATLSKVQAETQKLATEAQAILHKANLDQTAFEVEAQVKADEQERLEFSAMANARNMSQQTAINEAVAMANADESARKTIQKEREQANREYNDQVATLKSEAEIALRSRELDIQEFNALKSSS